MKQTKSLLFLSLAGGMTLLTSACNDWQIAGSALGASMAVQCIATNCIRPVYVAPYPVYQQNIVVQPIYVPRRPVWVDPPPTLGGPFQNQNRNCTDGPFGCRIMMNDIPGSESDSKLALKVTPEELVAMGNQKYDIEIPAMRELVASLRDAQNGEAIKATARLGLNSKMQKEFIAGEVSKESSAQIATALGTSVESADRFFKDYNSAMKSKSKDAAPQEERLPDTTEHNG